MKRVVVGLSTLILSSTLAAQTGRVSVAGDVPKPVALSIEELEKLPQESLTVELEGQKVTFSGPSVHAVLGLAGLKLDDPSRPINRTRHVIVGGADGYTAAYGLLEFDPGVTATNAIVALKRNGNALDASEGPLRLVTSGDKRATRWVKQTVRIGVGRDAS
jgi:DMSO/TMAO reductase YedYZ molybdopterin-dependent catalytic subunit